MHHTVSDFSSSFKTCFPWVFFKVHIWISNSQCTAAIIFDWQMDVTEKQCNILRRKKILAKCYIIWSGFWSTLVSARAKHGLLTRYVKLPRTFSPPPRVSYPDMHHGTCVTHVPWCMPGSLTSRFLWSLWRGKRSRHSRRMCNPQFYVSGKRPMSRLVGQPISRRGLVGSCPNVAETHSYLKTGSQFCTWPEWLVNIGSNNVAWWPQVITWSNVD